jgi:bifunctional N-acetylglucosamine-1-phosphate-uridyltransferase/glucosamine-1-phosphate-acetyltransferase GlmU-like protein
MAQLNNPAERSSAVETLGLLLKGQRLGKNSLSPAAADQIQRQLLVLTGDSSGLIRKLTVRALAFAKPSPEAVSALRKIANEDPYQKSRTTEGATATVYPIREEATATLKAWGVRH